MVYLFYLRTTKHDATNHTNIVANKFITIGFILQYPFALVYIFISMADKYLHFIVVDANETA